MLALIQEKIKKLGCTVWELRENTSRGWEFYFIRHMLDQNRVTEVRTISVTLYRLLEDGFLGAASGEISPTSSEKEIEKALSDIYFQASLVKNPVYTLTDKQVIPPQPKTVDMADIAKSFITAMAQVGETETEDINSYEIFVRENSRHFLNSNEVEYTVCFPSSMIEIVVNARSGAREIEVYRMLRSGTCDAEKLCRDTEKAIRYAKDRLIAEATPKLDTCDVLFSTEDAVRIYEYFYEKTSADMIFRQLSDWTRGTEIAPNMVGDRITMKAVSSLENSSADYSIDEEGAAICDRTLIRSGVVENLWGHRQFCQYLGMEDSSIVRNIMVEGGTHSEEDLRKEDCLEVVEFSDFQVDPVSGDIAGEIRLAYLYRNGTVSIVSGGSVTGQMADVIPTMEFSAEIEQYDNFVIPKVTRLKNLKITGVE